MAVRAMCPFVTNAYLTAQKDTGLTPGKTAVPMHGIAIGGDDGEIRTFSLRKVRDWGILAGEGGKEAGKHRDKAHSRLHSMQGHEGAIVSLHTIFRRDAPTTEGGAGLPSSVDELASERLVSASHDRTIRVWDPKTGRCEKTLRGHGDIIVALSRVGSEGLFASVAEDKTVRIWNLSLQESPAGSGGRFGSCVMTILLCPSMTTEAHKSWVRCIAGSPDGHSLLTGSDDKDLRRWSLQGKCRSVYQGHRDAVYAVATALSPVGLGEDVVLSGGRDGDVRVWGLESTDCVFKIGAHQSWVLSLAVLPSALGDSASDGVFASTSADNEVKVWKWDRDTPGSLQLQHNFTGHEGGATCATMVNDVFVTADNDDTVAMWA